MPFQDLIDDVNDLCVEVLGDSASITNGGTTIGSFGGFFRPSWDESTSGRFGFMAEVPTFECKVADLEALNPSEIDDWWEHFFTGDEFRLTYGGVEYVVMDKRLDHGMTLLVLQR